MIIGSCNYYHLNPLSHLSFTGIGIDDTFVMLAAWRRTSPKSSVEIRMAETLSEAAVSITITSLTDMISFWIGIISPFPSVRIFCTYSGFAVLFTFAWHITFFAGCMAISGYREEKNRHSLFGCKVEPMSVAIKGKCDLFDREREVLVQILLVELLQTTLNKGKSVVYFHIAIGHWGLWSVVSISFVSISNICVDEIFVSIKRHMATSITISGG